VQHEDWITSIEVTADGAERVEALELPLVGVSADSKGSEPNAIEVEVGRGSSDQLTHLIEDAERVRFSQSDDEAQLLLEIESSDGERTAIRLRRATREELASRPKKERSRRATG
jgi:hypothetical protein